MTTGLRCPKCGASLSGSRVLETRPSPGALRRRRLCRSCGEQTTTYEVVGVGLPSGRYTRPPVLLPGTYYSPAPRGLRA